jgi:hypothetical protein
MSNSQSIHDPFAIASDHSICITEGIIRPNSSKYTATKVKFRWDLCSFLMPRKNSEGYSWSSGRPHCDELVTHHTLQPHTAHVEVPAQSTTKPMHRSGIRTCEARQVSHKMVILPFWNCNVSSQDKRSLPRVKCQHVCWNWIEKQWHSSSNIGMQQCPSQVAPLYCPHSLAHILHPPMLARCYSPNCQTQCPRTCKEWWLRQRGKIAYRLSVQQLRERKPANSKQNKWDQRRKNLMTVHSS